MFLLPTKWIKKNKKSFLFFYLFIWCYTCIQEYFTLYDGDQRYGGRKLGDGALGETLITHRWLVILAAHMSY